MIVNTKLYKITKNKLKEKPLLSYVISINDYISFGSFTNDLKLVVKYCE